MIVNETFKRAISLTSRKSIRCSYKCINDFAEW